MEFLISWIFVLAQTGLHAARIAYSVENPECDNYQIDPYQCYLLIVLSLVQLGVYAIGFFILGYILNKRQNDGMLQVDHKRMYFLTGVFCIYIGISVCYALINSTMYFLQVGIDLLGYSNFIIIALLYPLLNANHKTGTKFLIFMIVTETIILNIMAYRTEFVNANDNTDTPTLQLLQMAIETVVLAEIIHLYLNQHMYRKELAVYDRVRLNGMSGQNAYGTGTGGNRGNGRTGGNK